MAKCSSEKISGHSLARSVARLARFGEVDEVLVNLARIVKRSVKSSWVVVYHLDRETGRFSPACSYCLPAEWEKRFGTIPLLLENQPLLLRMFARRRQLLIADPAIFRSLLPLLPGAPPSVHAAGGADADTAAGDRRRFRSPLPQA